MERFRPQSKQELIDKTAETFKEEREPKFPTVRERLLEGIVKPDQEVFISSFDHPNPAYPDRVLTGYARASEVVKALKPEGVRGVSMVMDMLAPRSERSAEGGGWSLGLGLVPAEIETVLDDQSIFYHRNKVLALDSGSILDDFSLALGKELALAGINKRERGTYARTMVARLGSYLALYNLTINEGRRSGHDTTKVLDNLRVNIDSFLQVDTTWMKRVAESKMMGNIANALEELAAQGFPFWQMPLDEKEAVLRQLDDTGKERGKGYVDGKKVSFVDNQGSIYDTREGASIFEAMRNGSIMPSAKLLMAAVMVAPEVPHMGNTYGLEQGVADWLQIDGQRLRLTRDNTDSSPVGRYSFAGKAGDYSEGLGASSVPLHMLHFTPERFRQLVAESVETGAPAFEDRKFGQIEL